MAFSARQQTALTRRGSLSVAIAWMAASAVAAPLMSLIISGMDLGGLRQSPPVSNVRPLPTMTRWSFEVRFAPFVPS